MKIIVYMRCYRLDPDPIKKVIAPDSAAQKSTDPHPCSKQRLIK